MREYDVAPHYVASVHMRSAFLAVTTLASLRKLVDHNVRLGESSNEARTVKVKYTGRLRYMSRMLLFNSTAAVKTFFPI